VNNNPSAPSARQTARRLRLAGIIALLLGLIGAGAVYWLGSRGPDFSEDPSMTAFDRNKERQMEILYGKQGELIENLTNDLKQPGTQAALIAAASVIAASACFYFARLTDDE
jgi:hypothetical protein